jgi:hypothetical protein
MGIYNTEKWIGLKKNKFNEFIFHIPVGKIEGALDFRPTINIIEGIVAHLPRKYSRLANFVLFLIYKRIIIWEYLKSYLLSREIRNKAEIVSRRIKELFYFSELPF